VEAGASTVFGSVRQTKSALAAELGALFAFSAITNNDKVGLVIFTDRIELALPPRKGTHHVLRVIREVLSLRPVGRGTNISAALEHLARVTKRRCVVFVVSDFLDPGCRQALRMASRRHDVIAVVLEDPREAALPAVGLVEVISAPDAEVFVEQPAERLGDFDIVDFGVEPPARREGKTVLTRWYRLVGYSPGDHVLQSPPVKYRVAGQEEAEAPAQEITVSVESLLAQTPNATDIRDIKAPEPVPVDWRPYYLLGGGIALLLAVVAILYRLLNRPRRARPAPPARPPHE